MNKAPKSYYSIFLAARFTGVAMSQVQMWVDQGKLALHRVDKFERKVCVEELVLLVKQLEDSSAKVNRGSSGVAQPSPSMHGAQYHLENQESLTSNADFVRLPSSLAFELITSPLFLQDESGDYLPIPSGTNPNDPDLGIPVFCRADDVSMVFEDVGNQFVGEVRKALNEELVSYAVSRIGDHFGELAHRPIPQSLVSLAPAVEFLVDVTMEKPELSKILLQTLTADRSPKNHSLNVMILALRVCARNRYTLDIARAITLSALFHDIGLMQFPLTVKNVSLIREPMEGTPNRVHPLVGSEILKTADFTCRFVSQGALEHHEFLDGSGWPNGLKKTSYTGQLLALIDRFDLEMGEAGYQLNDQSMLKVLQGIKKDCEKGKYNFDLLKQFAFSLT